MELLIGVLVVLAVLWWLRGGDGLYQGPPPRQPDPPAAPGPVPPPAAPMDPDDPQRHRRDAALAADVVLGWLVYREWIDDDAASGDGWAEHDLDGDVGDGLDGDLDEDIAEEAWDELDGGLGV